VVAADITTKALIATITAASKTYDGNTTATNAPVFTLSGLVGTETVAATGAGTFNTVDVATANLVTANSNTLVDGTGLASNYSLVTGQTIASTITAKALIATITAASKTYDGNTTATNAPVFTITDGLVGAETVTATGAGTFDSKDVLIATTVTADSNALADGDNGGLASNYTLATGQTITSTITTKALTVTGISANNKVYDSTPTATLNGIAVLLPSVAPGSGSTSDGRAYTSDDVNLISIGNGLFDNADYGNAKAVTVSGLNIEGPDAANYRVAQPTGLTADISALSVVPSVPVLALNVSTTVTVIPSSSTNVMMNIGNQGSTLQIVTGGILLPGSALTNMIDQNEDQNEENE
jgi:hypothetical protein